MGQFVGLWVGLIVIGGDCELTEADKLGEIRKRG